MSSPESDSADSLISVARAVRTRGLKGEIVADLLTDFPQRFNSVERLVALSSNGERRIVELEDFWFQKDRIILKFANCDTVEAAGELIGYEFCVPEAERVMLAQDEYYDFELEGCAVREKNGRDVGRVRAIWKTGGAEILVITSSDDAEVLVPLAESIVIEIDTVGKEIVIDPPEGLLELS
jgi:16S rRNA processing protein RimM